MALTSDELNIIVYRYLLESDFRHSAYIFGFESQVIKLNVSNALVPVGALINIVQKGIMAEMKAENDGTDLEHNIEEDLPQVDEIIPEPVVSQRRRRKNRQSRIRTNENQTEEDGENAVFTTTDIIKLSSSVELPSVKYTALKGHEAEVFICSWCPTTDIVASGSGDGTARIWDVRDNEFTHPPHTLDHCMKKIESNTPGSKDVTTIDWKFDGKFLATGTCDGYARIWHRDGRISTTLGKHQGPIFAMKWNKNGSYIVSAGMDRKTYIWDVICNNNSKQMNFHSAAILDIDWLTHSCFATCGVDKMIHVCEVNLDEPIKLFKGHTNEINVIKWNPEGTLLASGSDDLTVKIWAMNHDTCVQDLQGHSKEIYTMKWSPTGPGTDNPNMNLRLASASYDASIILWDVERGEQTQVLKNHSNPIYGLDFSPDGKFLASGSYDRHVNVWSMQDYKLVHSFDVSSPVHEVCWNHTSNKLCASSYDGQVHILDLKKP